MSDQAPAPEQPASAPEASLAYTVEVQNRTQHSFQALLGDKVLGAAGYNTFNGGSNIFLFCNGHDVTSKLSYSSKKELMNGLMDIKYDAGRQDFTQPYLVKMPKTDPIGKMCDRVKS